MSALDAQSNVQLLDQTTNGTCVGTCVARVLTLTCSSADEEDDVFQCGKCRHQFSALEVFLNHKKTCGRRPAQSVNTTTGSVLNSQSLSGPISTQAVLIEPNSPSIGSNVIHISESDILSFANSVQQSNVQIEQSGTLNAGTLSLIATSATDSLTSSSATNATATLLQSNNGTIGFPVSLFANGGLLSGTPLLVATNSPSNNENDITSVTISPNIVLNITTPTSATLTNQTNTTVQSAANKAQSNSKVLTTQKKLDAAINVLPTPEMKLPSVTKIKKRKVEPPKDVPPQPLAEEDTASADPNNKKIAKLKCTFCDRAFSKNFDLQQHIRCHTGEKPFQCIVCGRAFAQKSNVKKHMQTHKVWPDGLAHTLPNSNGAENEDGANDSQVALDEFLEEQNMDTENQNKSVDSSYACPYCAYTGKTYFELKSHMKTHKREKVYKCIQSSCGKMFSELEPFLDHIQSHDTEMTYRCHQCTKTFHTLYDLGVHQYSHSLYPNQGARAGQKYYRCQKCLNKYTTPAALEHHIATSTHHYPCTHCNKVFPCERYLRRHLLTHGTGLHICQFCEKTFKTANYLKVHLVIHTGEKPYGERESHPATHQLTFSRSRRLQRVQRGVQQTR